MLKCHLFVDSFVVETRGISLYHFLLVFSTILCYWMPTCNCYDYLKDLKINELQMCLCGGSEGFLFHCSRFCSTTENHVREFHYLESHAWDTVFMWAGVWTWRGSEWRPRLWLVTQPCLPLASCTLALFRRQTSDMSVKTHAPINMRTRDSIVTRNTKSASFPQICFVMWCNTLSSFHKKKRK